MGHPFPTPSALGHFPSENILFAAASLISRAPDDRRCLITDTRLCQAAGVASPQRENSSPDVFNMRSSNNGQRFSGNGQNNNGGHRRPAPAPLNTPFSGLGGGGKKAVVVGAPAPSKPQGQSTPDCKVVMSSLHSEVLKIAQVLCVQHGRGDVTILDVFYPTKKAQSWGKPAAISEPITLTGAGLRHHGDRYQVIQVMVSPSGACFQVFAPENDKLEPKSKVVKSFPDIRAGQDRHFKQLSELTGLKFGANLQIRWKEYSAIRTEAELEAYNARELELFRQAMTEFADVCVGTPLHIARKIVAARLASEGAEVDTSCPTFGFDNHTEVTDQMPSFSPARELAHA